MFFYRLNDKTLFSDIPYDMPPIDEVTAKKEKEFIYSLTQIDPQISRRMFTITHKDFIFLKSEGIHLLRTPDHSLQSMPKWLEKKIRNHKLVSLNTRYPNWQKALLESKPSKEKWKVNVIGLGDVGGMLVTGLRLLGGSSIAHIGIYDMDENKTKRWVFEANQVLGYDEYNDLPEVFSLTKSNLFDCDMFVFCVSGGIPEVGKEIKDVRMAQLEKNSSIVKVYAKAAREKNFNGIFAVVSDPVDLLCECAYISSNTNENGEFDNKGLLPDQIRGYGLGVMNARARFFSEQSNTTKHYKNEGRAYGPHGEGLVIADSVINYNEELSEYLTEKTLKANLDVRALGFKPYIAPALSSGSLSLIATIEGKWHYSTTFLGGVFMGAKNRLTAGGTEIETINMDVKLFNRLSITYNRLHMIL